MRPSGVAPHHAPFSVPPNTRVQRTRSSASPPCSPLMRCPLGSRGSLRGHIALVGTTLILACASSRESAFIRVTDLHGSNMVGVEVRTGDIKAFSNLDGVATFHDLAPGPHEFNAYFNWSTSCGPATVDVKQSSTAAATITMRPVPGQGWVNQDGNAVTPTAEDLATQAVEDSLPCPERPNTASSSSVPESP